MPNLTKEELIRRWATEDCHISVALLISRLEREALTAQRNGDTMLSTQKYRVMEFYQRILSRACTDERLKRGIEEDGQPTQTY